MSKANRYWWLHGLIVAAAVAGCKSSTCSSCGGSAATPTPAAAAAYQPIATPGTTGAYPTTSSGTPTYQGTSSAPSYTPPASTTTTYPGLGGRFETSGSH